MTYARVLDGLVYCWGPNIRGEMGNGTLATQIVASVAAQGEVFESVSVGGTTVCGILAGLSSNLAFDLHCWGDGK